MCKICGDLAGFSQESPFASILGTEYGLLLATENGLQPVGPESGSTGIYVAEAGQAGTIASYDAGAPFDGAAGLRISANGPGAFEYAADTGGATAPASAQGIGMSATGNAQIDGLLSGYRWSGTLTYSFPDAAADYPAGYGFGEPTAPGFAQISLAQQTATHRIMQQMGDVTNLTIQYAGTNSADIRLAQSSEADPTAYAYYPGANTGGDVWFGTQYSYRSPVLGDYYYATHIHELGHSFGLKHSQALGGVANVAVPSAHDAMEFTVMSYRSYVGGPTTGYSNEDYGYPTTYMMNDILALQTMYGADYTYNDTNTVYTWSSTTGQMFVDGIGQGQPGANRVFLTVWDGGGIDTYDLSNYASGVRIDLNPAAYSTTSAAQIAYLGGGNYAHGNVYNAYLFNNDGRSYIENAIGGSGNDQFAGNATANRLDGRGGNDILTGGAGSNSFIYGAGYGADIIVDFIAGGVDDAIYLLGLSGVSTFQDVIARTAQVGANTVLTFGSGQTLTLNNVTLSNLNAADFSFSLADLPPAVTNLAPTGISLSNSSIAEEIYGVTIGTVTVADPNGDTAFTFSVSDARFEVVGGPGAYQLKLIGGAVLDYETQPSVALTLTATDAGGLSKAQSLTIAVTNVDGFTITGSAAGDTIDATQTAPGQQRPTSENDTIHGNGGNDTISALAGNDAVYGDAGADTLKGMAGADLLDGGTGADRMEGGEGDDTYIVDDAGDVVVEGFGPAFAVPAGWTVKGTADLNGDGELDIAVTNGSLNQLWLLRDGALLSSHALPAWAGWPMQGLSDLDGDGDKDVLYLSGSTQYAVYLNGVAQTGVAFVSGKTIDAVQPLIGKNAGIDVVQSSVSFTLTEGVEKVTLASGAGAIDGTGNALANVIVGNESANRITGKAGADVLVGNGGADVFAYDNGETGAALGTRDRITDFAPGVDQLDLSAIDANAAVAGDQAFRFLGTGAFDGAAGALRYGFDAVRNVTVLEGDTNGDRVADFAIDLTGNKTLTQTEFAAGSLLQPLNLVGTPGPDTLQGGELGDTLQGLGGNDILTGDAGADQLDGGTGADRMEGGAGDDTYTVDDAGDVVVEGFGPAFAVPAGWTVKGTADLNGDGELDIAVTNGSLNQLWLLRDGAQLSTHALPAWAGWPMQGLSDLDGDGDKDVLYLSGSTQYAVYLNGVAQTGMGSVSGKTVDAVQPLVGKNAGTDTVHSAVSYTLGEGVENLVLTSAAGPIGGTGNTAANTIIGNESANRITGKAGADVLVGNGGANVFAYDDGETGAALGARDRITDFAPGLDQLDLSAIDANAAVAGDQAFRFLGTGAFDGAAAALRYGFDAVRNVTVLEGDTNGDRVADFAIDLSGNKTLSQGDFGLGSLLQALNLMGTSGPDTLQGGELGDTLQGLGGNDILKGDAGADQLDGGTGADRMEGGAGDDTYTVDDAGDVVVEGFGPAFAVPAGWTVKGTADLNNDGELDIAVTNGSLNQLWLLRDGALLSTHALPVWAGWPMQGLSDLDGDGDKDVLYLSGATQYAVYLNGVAQTGTGYVSGKTIDAVQPLVGKNAGTDGVSSSISYALVDGVENLTLAVGAGAIDGTGNTAANTIIGNEDANRITGKAGADVLVGNGGADVFAYDDGETGAALGTRDRITDFVPGLDLLDLVAIDANAAVAGDQAFRFLGTAAFDGAAGALRYGFDAVRNVTVLEGDTNGDRVADFAIDLSGNKALSQGDFGLGSLLQALNLMGTPGPDTLQGGELGDTLQGLGGNDILIGDAGNDVLNGGIDADRMEGGAGDDTYTVDEAGDAVVEGFGPAFAVPAGWTVKGTADLNGDGELDVAVTNGSVNQLWLLRDGALLSTHALPVWAGWPMQGLSDLDGDGDKDVLYLSGSTQYAVYLNGVAQTGVGFVSGKTIDAVQPLVGRNAGTDGVISSISYTLGDGVENLTLANGAGPINGSGNGAANTITGNESANQLSGGAGNDVLVGNAGADTLTGGAGNDRLIGGSESDRFVFGASFGDDVIEGFAAGAGSDDRIDLGAFGIVPGNLTIQQSGLDTVITSAAFAGGKITLQNVALANLHPDDFIF